MTSTVDAYGSRPVSRRHRRSTAELAAIDEAIIHAVIDEHPVSLRGVYYRVVSAGAVDKTELGYRLVGRQLLKLRRARVVPYSWITDGTRWVVRPDTHSDVEQMLTDAAASYRRALWHDQPVEVHVFTEKDAITGVIDGVTSTYDVPLGVLRGYCSESFAHSMAEAIDAAGKPVFVYQLGDHDPSGIDAWRDFQRKVIDFLRCAQLERIGHYVGVPAVFERLAVTEAQIDDLNLPTRPTKRTDSRAAGFTGGSVEVDAIPPRILRQLVEDAIAQHIDPRAGTDPNRRGLRAGDPATARRGMVTVTHMLADLSATPEELRAEVHRLVEPVVRSARLRHRSLPAVGSAAWWSAPDEVRRATVLVLGEAYIAFSPADAVAAERKAVSLAISGGLDWSRNSHRMIFESPTKLAARRAIAATPIRCGHPGCLKVVSVDHPLPADWSTVRCPRPGHGSVAP